MRARINELEAQANNNQNAADILTNMVVNNQAIIDDELEAKRTDRVLLKSEAAAVGATKPLGRTESEVLAELGADSGTQREVLHTHVSEVFCPPRFTRAARNFGLTPGLAMDLTNGWDLNDPAQLASAWKHLKDKKLYLFVGSPECSPFSKLRSLNRNHANYQETLRKCVKHLEVVCAMYEFQHRHGRLFLHGHPCDASNWHLPCVQKTLGLEGVGHADCDQ